MSPSAQSRVFAATVGVAGALSQSAGGRSAPEVCSRAAQRERVLRWFAVYVAGHVALEHWFVVAAPWSDGSGFYRLHAVLATVAAAVLLSGRTRLGAALLAAIVLSSVLSAFPGAPNHMLLELLCLLAIATHAPESEPDAAQLSQVLTGLLAATLFGAGVQKILYGTYTHGTYLAFAIANTDRFARVWQLVVPEAEFTRLRALSGVFAEGTGPFAFESPALLLLSNGVYVLEIGLSLLLLVPRARAVAGMAAIVLVCAIELCAQEAFFGCLTINLAALACGGRRYGRVAAGSLAVLALTLVGRVLAWPAFQQVN